MKPSKIFLSLTILILIILIIIFPQISLKSARSGLNAWFNTVVPSLLPFFVGSSLLVTLGITDFIAVFMEPIMKPIFHCSGYGAYIFIMSITSGYPMGAKLVSELRLENKMDSYEAQRILSFSSTSGPLFIIGAVASGMLGIPWTGAVILISHYISAIITGVLFRNYGFKKYKTIPSKKINVFRKAMQTIVIKQKGINKSFGEILSESVKNSINSLLMVGGFIIIFSVMLSIMNEIKLTHLLSYILSPLLSSLNIPINLSGSLISGFFEMTNGCIQASQSSVGLIYKMMILSGIISWGGLSVHAQSLSFLSKTDIKFAPYILSKAIQSVIAFIITGIMARCIISTDSVFYNTKNIIIPTWSNVFCLSFILFIICTLLMLITAITVKSFKKKY